MPSFRPLARAFVALALGAGATAPAAAQSFHAGVGSIGLVAGFGHRLDPSFGARLELSFVPSIGRSFTEGGITYEGDVRSTRGAAIGDWHPFGSGFRISAGLSAGNTSGSFSGLPSVGTSVTVGGVTGVIGPADRYNVQIAMPSAMPYVGIGWGGSQAPGWGLHVDVGVLIGSSTVTGSLSPSLRAKISAVGLDPDAELERQLQILRDTVAKISVLPAVTIGASYRW